MISQDENLSKIMGRRDHLFISYATEDQALADWLAFKLVSEGYKIWYDRLKLLGGESYPRDITTAIEEESFRVIALLSNASIKKPNPIKEITLATNISRERGIDFLVPIRVDNLKPTQLNFLVSDLVYIPFNEGWSSGLYSLLKKLQDINAPRNTVQGRADIFDWLRKEQLPFSKHERIWSNVLQITEIPRKIKKYSVDSDYHLSSLEGKWAFWRWENEVFGLVSPPEEAADFIHDTELIDYQSLEGLERIEHEKILKSLIIKSIRVECLKKGMIYGGLKNNILHFPFGIFPDNKLWYKNHNGRRTYVKVSGDRRFSKFIDGKYSRVQSRYHLSVKFRVLPSYEHVSLIGVKLGLYMTDLSSYPLPAKTANARRKAICKDWWNQQWLSRMFGVVKWLADGNEDLTLVESENGNLTLNSSLLSHSAEFGIDEEDYENIEEENDTLEEDSSEEDEHDFEEP